MADRETVHLKLDRDEALVLFAFLQREIDDADAVRLRLVTDHDSELWALNALNCLLERELVEPFQSDYEKLLARAKAALVEQCGAWPN